MKLEVQNAKDQIQKKKKQNLAMVEEMKAQHCARRYLELVSKDQLTKKAYAYEPKIWHKVKHILSLIFLQKFIDFKILQAI